MRYDILALCPCIEPARLPWKLPSLLVEDIDTCIGQLQPSFSLRLGDTVDADHVQLTFQRFKEFKPTSILDKLPRTPQAKPFAAPRPNSDAQDSALEGLFAMVDVAESPQTAVPSEAGQFGKHCLQRLFADPGFCAVERSWQAIRRLVGTVCTSGKVTLRILPTDHEHLDHTLEILEQEVDRVLPSLLLVDAYFGSSNRDCSLLQALYDLAENCGLPVLTGLSPRFFGIKDWSELEYLSYLAHHLEQVHYAKWRKLLGRGHLLHLSANEFLLRPIHGQETENPLGFFESEPPWINPAWAAAEAIGQSMLATGMPTRFTGMPAALADLHPGNTVRGMGIVTRGLPSHDKIEQAASAGVNLLAPVVDRDTALFLHGRSASGQPFAGRLFACHIARVLTLARDTYLGDGRLDSVRTHVKSVFDSFWAESGGPPDAWKTEVVPSEADTIRVAVSVTPAPRMSPGCEPVRFEIVFSAS
jgi:hypothetical protein